MMKYERQMLRSQPRRSRTDPSGVDRLFVRFSGRHQWIDYWESNIIPVERLTIGACADCGWMTFSNLNVHLQASCPNRPVTVATDTDVKVAAIGAVTLKVPESPMQRATPPITAQGERGNEPDDVVLCVEITDRYLPSLVVCSSQESKFNVFSNHPIINFLLSGVKSGVKGSNASLNVHRATVGPVAGQIVDFRQAEEMAVTRVAVENFLNAPPTEVCCSNCGAIVDR